MGTICLVKDGKESIPKSEAQKGKEVIKIPNVTNNKNLRFQVTTDKVIHISADLLILFMDHTTNIKRNDHFLKLPLQGIKLQEHAMAFLEKHKMSHSTGESGIRFITFNIIIPTLNFPRVSILFCDTWREGNDNQPQLKELLQAYFDSIASQTFKSIAITEFTSELGVNLQKGANSIIREIIRRGEKPELVQFCCLNEDSKAVFAQAINKNRQEISRSLQTTTSKHQSDYF